MEKSEKKQSKDGKQANKKDVSGCRKKAKREKAKQKRCLRSFKGENIEDN